MRSYILTLPCVGQALVKNDIIPLIEKIKYWFVLDRNINWYKSERIDNLPKFKKIKEYSINLPNDYIEKNITGHTNGNVKIYDLITIYRDTLFMSYAINKIANNIKKLNINAIVSPEARALPLAGAIANKLNLPLFVIRKKGKIPGPVYRKVLT